MAGRGDGRNSDDALRDDRRSLVREAPGCLASRVAQHRSSPGAVERSFLDPRARVRTSGDQRLAAGGSRAYATDHRATGECVCEGKGHQTARLCQGALSMSMSTPAILVVESIALSYGGIIPALRDVSLVVPQGA